MSAVHLLRELQFSKANNYDVHGLLEEKSGKERSDPTSNKQESLRLLVFTFKFSYAAIIQVGALWYKQLELVCRKEGSTVFVLTNIEGNLLGDLIDYEAFLGLNLIKRTRIDMGQEKQYSLCNKGFYLQRSRRGYQANLWIREFFSGTRRR